MQKAHIRIFLADPQYLVREGLKAIVASMDHLQIVGEAGSPKVLREKLVALKPNLVIMDESSQGFSTEDIAWIRKESPKSELLIICSELKKEKIQRGFELGARGFLTKECDREEIQEAIDATLCHDKFFCNKVLNAMLDRPLDTPPESGNPCDPVHISKRELDIIRLMSLGYNAPTIAKELSLSVHTVYTHRKNIHRKLGVKSATAVVLQALRLGMV